MKALVLAGLLLLGAAESQAACEATPRPIENESNTRAGTLLLKSHGTYYVMDSCVTVSRWQHGPIMKLGFLNKVGDWEGATFFSAKANRTFVGMPLRQFSLVRSPGWQLGQPLPKMKEGIYKGSVADWNDVHSTAKNPEDFSSGRGFPVPWHAYVDSEKATSSTADLNFWLVDPPEMTFRSMLTNYLIRFTPSNSGILLDFDVYIPDDVEKVELFVSSAVEPLRHRRTFIIVP
jgi:hypothetical protein